MRENSVTKVFEPLKRNTLRSILDMPDFNLECVHPSWKDIIYRGLASMDPAYLKTLQNSENWLPGSKLVFNAFSQPIDKVHYVLFGESPYPRAHSANGFAFWDAAVTDLWSEQGMTKKVNRATSLRNFIKMLLLAEGCLNANDLSQAQIAKINKEHLIQTNNELFQNLLQQGFLLLNTTLVLHTTSPQYDARFWRPFMHEILNFLVSRKQTVTFILLGNVAKIIEPLIDSPHAKVQAEHPYNHSFITNPRVLSFFRPLHLLRAKKTEV